MSRNESNDGNLSFIKCQMIITVMCILRDHGLPNPVPSLHNPNWSEQFELHKSCKFNKYVENTMDGNEHFRQNLVHLESY